MENENTAPVESVSEVSPADLNNLDLDWEEDSAEEAATTEPVKETGTQDESEPDDLALAEGEEEAEGQDESAQAEPLLASDDMVVEIDGQKIAVKDLKDGHLMQADYTKSKQALSQERGQVQELGKNLSGALERVVDYLASKLPPEPDPQLAYSDPNRHYQMQILHNAALAEMQSILGMKQGAEEATNMLDETAFKTLMSESDAAIIKQMPHLKDPKRLDAFNRTVTKAAKELGASEEDIKTTTSPIIRLLAYHAAYGMEARKNAAKAKAKVQTAPVLPTQRSKTPASETNARLAAAQRRFDTNPSPDNAALLLSLDG